MPTIPFRHALPELSLILTPILISVCFSTSFWISAALLSGSSGNNNTLGFLLSDSIFERSIPALAWINPRLFSTTITPFLYLMTSLDSLRINCTSLGSLSVFLDSSLASGEGLISFRNAYLPSDLEIIF